VSSAASEPPTDRKAESQPPGSSSRRAYATCAVSVEQAGDLSVGRGRLGCQLSGAVACPHARSAPPPTVPASPPRSLSSAPCTPCATRRACGLLRRSGFAYHREVFQRLLLGEQTQPRGVGPEAALARLVELGGQLAGRPSPGLALTEEAMPATHTHNTTAPCEDMHTASSHLSWCSLTPPSRRGRPARPRAAPPASRSGPRSRASPSPLRPCRR
jgi:hypothetical protein